MGSGESHLGGLRYDRVIADLLDMPIEEGALATPDQITRTMIDEKDFRIKINVDNIYNSSDRGYSNWNATSIMNYRAIAIEYHDEPTREKAKELLQMYKLWYYSVDH